MPGLQRIACALMLGSALLWTACGSPSTGTQSTADGGGGPMSSGDSGGSSGSPEASSAGSGDAQDGSRMACPPSTGFAATPSAFSVPPPRCQVAFNEAAASAQIAYATMDLTADGHPDLVVFRDQCDSSVGETHWDVYPWSSSGFAATPDAFAVPPARCQVAFNAAAASAQIAYATMDLTADGHPDLVVFQDQCDSSVGKTHWDVYPWTASGFAATPSAFAVPPARCQVAFNEAAASAQITYATMDLTADGRPDLVVFQDQCASSVGQTHWDVYPWSSSGFAATPSAFAVPPPRCQVAFNEAAATEQISYAAVALTAAAQPDLVVFQDTCDSTVGQTHWDVYGWTPSGFTATPTAFAVPPPRCAVAFNEAAATEPISYATMPLTSACGVSLVVFRDACAAAVGQTHWDVYGPVSSP